jgi:colanic acid biosynthesis glycosyl transferase WcaI
MQIKKILICSMNYAPELTGIGKYSHEMAIWLKKRGVKVRVICSPPYYPDWRIFPNYKNRYHQINTDGIQTYRCPILIPKKITGKTRILHLTSYALSSGIEFFKHLFWKPNLIICVAPNLLSCIVPLLIAKIIHIKSWIHIQDFEICAAEQLELIRNKFILKALYWIEKKIYGNFDKVTTISEAMRDRLINLGINPGNISLMPNWANLEEICPLEKNDFSLLEFRKKLGIDVNKRIALYSGSISEKQGLEILIPVAKFLSEFNILIIVCGNGANLQKLKNLSKDLANIRFIDLVPFNELNLLLNLADVHLLVQKNEIDNQVMPSKLANIIAVGGPIVATVQESSNIHKIINENKLGLTVPYDDPLLLTNAIQQILNNNELSEFSTNCLIYCKKNLSIDEILNKNIKC